MNNLTETQAFANSNKLEQTSENYQRYIEAPRLYAFLLFALTYGGIVIASYRITNPTHIDANTTMSLRIFRLIWIGLIAYTSVFVFPRLRFGVNASEESGPINRRFLRMPILMLVLFAVLEYLFWRSLDQNHVLYSSYFTSVAINIAYMVLAVVLLIVPLLYLAAHGERKWGKTKETPPKTTIRAVEFKITMALYLFMLSDYALQFGLRLLGFD